MLQDKLTLFVTPEDIKTLQFACEVAASRYIAVAAELKHALNPLAQPENEEKEED